MSVGGCFVHVDGEAIVFSIMVWMMLISSLYSFLCKWYVFSLLCRYLIAAYLCWAGWLEE